MKDARFAIHSAFYSKLQGQITLNGDPVPVIDQGGDDDVSYPRIVFSEWTETEMSDKTSFGSEYTFLVKIWDRTDQPDYSRANVYDVINQLKQIIRVRPQGQCSGFNLTDFNIISCTIDSSNSLPTSASSTYQSWGEAIRWRLLVENL